MSSSSNFFSCLIVFGVLLVSVNGIKCYKDKSNTIDSCVFCGFSNTSQNYHGTVTNNVVYYCLHSVTELSIPGAPKAVLDKCLTSHQDSNAGSFDYSVYACDTDLCNDRCGNAGSTVALSGLIATLMVIVSLVKEKVAF